MQQQTNPLTQSMLVKEDHICSICLTAYYVPVQLASCKHIFCQNCIEDTVILTGNRTCPLCRAPFSPQQVKPLANLWQEIQASYPIVIEEKKKTIKNKKLLYLRIGNTTEVRNVQEQNNYKWKLFVKTAEGQKSLKQYAKKVEIKLHPTFPQNRIIEDFSHKDIVELERIGWGTFRIGITIFWKDKYEQKSTQFFHDLDFSPLAQKQIGCYLHEKIQ